MKKADNNNNLIYIIGDYNLYFFDYRVKQSTQKFYNELFKNGAFPLIDRPTRITEKTASIIDNIVTNDVFNESLKKGIIKSDISDHFPIFFSINIKPKVLPNERTTFLKRFYNEANLLSFYEQLSLLHWKDINTSSDVNFAYNQFFKSFYEVYDVNFPKCEINLKTKSVKSPWITNTLRKSSKVKQKLYIKYLKEKTIESKTIYKKYAREFEKIRKNLKKKYYSDLLMRYECDSKRTWQILREITGKTKIKSCALKNGIKISYDPREIAIEQNKLFVTIGPNLARNIPNIKKTSDISSIALANLDFLELSFEEFETAFSALKPNKASGFDDINSNVIKNSYKIIKDVLFKIFSLSIRQGIFPDQFKIAKITPIFKGGDLTNINNYRPISVLPVFSKVLE
ncbi:uncharacterized protein LOC136082726 [Hydra vulgaris]|uniref:uncharacterized protein LOC136082726 n=1 Tax=Hydra vulgaris TaxID=6087 RepID=UPI0032EA3D4E